MNPKGFSYILKVPNDNRALNYKGGTEMYINNKPTAEYAVNVNERVLNYRSKKEEIGENSGRVCRSHIGNKTWPEVIRLYKEFKKEQALRS